MIGKTLLHYRITGRLGAGGMGEVFVAEDQKLRRSVALKVLPPAFALNPENRQRFEHEARVVGALNHPNIVTIYSVESVDDQLFITMELVRGVVLADRIPREGMRVTEFLDVAIPMADAVAAAHDSGVVHRDLKPHNVMVSEDGRVKVLDFGLAQTHALSDASSSDVTRPPLTAEGLVVGTFAYMAPEQAEGRRVDARSDIFSLGAVFYEMLSGAAPFKGGTAVSTLAAVIKDDPRRLSDLRADLPRDLSRLVTRCLAKDPNRRYQSAADLRTDLEDVKLDLSVGVVDPSVATQGRKWRTWIAVPLVLAMVAASGFLGYRARETSPTVGPTLDGSFERLTSRSGEELFPTVSPDGEFVAYASVAAGNWDIYLQRIGGERPINLTDDSASADTEPAYSPDGRTIAFRSERDGGGIFVMGATGENVKRVSTIGHNPSWSPSGGEILINEDPIIDPMARSGTKGQLWAIEVASGKRRPLTTPMDAVQASWSPNGHRIAFWGVHRGGQRDIWTIASSGGDPKPVTTDEALDWNPIWAPDGRHLYFASERGGSMNLWRVPIDERSGEIRGAFEPVTTPSGYSQHLSFARNGRRLAYVEVARRVHLQRLSFDPEREQVVGAPSWILQDAKPVKNPQLSTDGKSFVFDSVEGSQEDLFLVRADGTGLRRLTDDGFKDRGPRWSPDGKQILFLSDRSGQYDVWRMNPDGSGLERVSFMTGERWAQAPLWSPDGNRILVNRNIGAPLIIDARVPFATQSPIVATPNDDDLDFFPWSWSPNGQVLAGHAHSYVGIRTYSLTSREFQQFTDFGSRPAWLADSRRLLFIDSQKVYVLDSVTKRIKEVYSAAPHRLQGMTVSSDNRSINISLAINEADIWLASLK
jgi:serine/threonine protein kinase/WD40 repeat protein